MLIIEALRRGGSRILLPLLTRFIVRAVLLNLSTQAATVATPPATRKPAPRKPAKKPAIPIAGHPRIQPSALPAALPVRPGPWVERRVPGGLPARRAVVGLLVLAIGLARHILSLLLLAAVAGLIALAIFTNLNTALVIRGGSMEPALPLGSLATIEQVDPNDLQAGDIVTVAADNGVLVTHRVTQIVEREGTTYLQLKGDANASTSPDLAPLSAVRGRVTTVLPLAGYLATLLATPSGLVSLLAFLGALLVATWLLEELGWWVEDATGQRRPAAVPVGSPRRAAA